MRLVIVGEGGERARIEAILAEGGVRDLAWLAGERHDIPAILRGLDVFVLPSFGEGVSNTILEAMSSGLPVVATRVGANHELVEDGVTGRVVAASDRWRLRLPSRPTPTIPRRRDSTAWPGADASRRSSASTA